MQRRNKAHINLVVLQRQIDVHGSVQQLCIAVAGIGGGGDDRRGLAIADPGQGEGQIGVKAIRPIAQGGVKCGYLADDGSVQSYPSIASDALMDAWKHQLDLMIPFLRSGALAAGMDV